MIFAEANRLLETDEAYARWPSAENPYGDGRAAERIVACLEHLLLGTQPAEPVRHRLQPRRGGDRRRHALRPRGRGRGAARRRSTRRRSAEPTAGVDSGELEQELAELHEAVAAASLLGEG